MRQRAFLWSGIFLVGISLTLMLVSILPGWSGKADPAIIFFAASAVLVFFLFTAPQDWLWKGWLYIPTALFLSLGIVFLFNALTQDWSAWSYAWLFCFAAIGIGVALAARTATQIPLLYNIGLGVAAGGLALFCLFGAIAGGIFIRIFSILLLGVIGVLSLLVTRKKIQWAVWNPISPSESASQSAQSVQAASAPTQQELVEPLSKRELEVLGWIEQGLTNAEIAKRLVVAQSTVKTHINNIYTKLGVETRAQAIHRARQLGILQ